MADETQNPAPAPAPAPIAAPAPIPVTPAPAELPPAPGFFGSNQWIAIGSAVFPFSVATIFVFTGKADAAWWGAFVGSIMPILAGISIGGSALIKTAAVIKS